MVKRFILLLSPLVLFLLITSFTVNLPPKVRIEIDAEALLEDEDIPVIITITHLQEQKIDPKSFRLDEQPIEVTFVSEESPESKAFGSKDSPDSLIVTTYRFSVPGQPSGLHLLPAVSLEVEGITVQSSAISYEVLSAQKTDDLRIEG